ncbi:MAG: LLM class flavin-dependent oxidoreductase [Pseudonocardiaceae bacterium]|nr:LLM class flavin-dependent oxidoreductase [Pseudonocardiaceae bacterium]
MRIGVGLPVCGAWASPENQLAVAIRAEELGYTSLWTLQRLLYAKNPRDEYYGAPGAQWPPYFVSVADPLVTAAYIAGHTREIDLGLAVLNAPFTNPVLLAKQLTTLDRVASGRLVVGLGLGWSRDEYAATGARWRGRGARFDEFLRCLVAAWTDDEVEFHGEYYEIPRCVIEPKP